jgi:ParB family chromosome partitioning protein
VDGGADAEAVARRFGATVRHVQGRLRLADLAEPIFAALAAGEITLDVAQAYGSTGDRERQAAAWERLSTSWQADNPQAIRRAIAEESLSADHPIARFLGEAEYVACGGRIERDLFAAEGEGRWLDGDLAMDLAAKKLAHEAEVAELGSKLAWVKPTLQPMSPMTRPRICTPTGRAGRTQPRGAGPYGRNLRPDDRDFRDPRRAR